MIVARCFHALKGTVIKSLQTPTQSLKKIISEKIVTEGPISFADYMDLCLSHPDFGYYNKGKIFGKEGDFITSPEISQLFGESLAVWIATLYNKLEAPDKWHIVELGPGKGTLAVDILRTLKSLNMAVGLSYHFIDLSPHLKKVQQNSILTSCKGMLQHEKYKNIERYFDKNTSFYWYSTLGEMNSLYLQEYKPQPVIIIGHEIFDALPIHIFEFSSKLGWCERMIDLNSYDQFDLVLSKGRNKNVNSILKPEKLTKTGIISDLKEGDRIELSPASLKLFGDICDLLKQGQSASLMIDYGENRAFGNSVRGIKDHKKLELEEWLQLPGEVDISAYVDFAALFSAASKYPELDCGELLPQGFFLEAMGISARIEMLAKKNPTKAQSLQKDYERLASPDQMGEIYKCFYTGAKSLNEVYPFTSSIIAEKNI